MNIRFTTHALEECERRNIWVQLIKDIVDAPQQIVPNVEGRRVYQSKIVFDDKIYLVRVIVEVTEQEFVIITLYRTSKIKKYWSE